MDLAVFFRWMDWTAIPSRVYALFDSALVASDGLLRGFRFPLLAGLIALVVSYALTPLVRKIAIEKGVVDDPKRDDRRVHSEPIPRWGGLAIFGGIVIAILAVLPFAQQGFPPYVWGLLVVGGLLVVAGALDDLYQYAAKVQLLILLGAGVLIQFFYTDPKARVQIAGFLMPFTNGQQYVIFPPVAAVIITAIYIFVVTKTMDTIDGIDGLCAGVATIAAITLTMIAVYEGQPRVALITAATGGAALGFLRHNYNPAKIFMGTGGAYILGFFLASLSVVGKVKTAAAVSIFMPMLVFALPILDAFWVVCRRILSGSPITAPDKRHLHHTLLGKGFTQRQTVWILYIAAAALSAVGLAIIKLFGQ